MAKTEEEKAAELATEEAKKAEAERLANLSEEEREAEDKAKIDNKIDYEAELTREKARREAAEKAAADSAFKLREAKRKEAEGDEGEEEKPLTAKQLQEVLARERQASRKELQGEMIREQAKKLAGSDSEANYIIEIHKNRTFPEGMSLGEQLEEAYAIANRKKLVAQNEELKRALRSKETKSSDSTGDHREAPPGSEPKFSSADVSAIKNAGFQWDGTARLYFKPLSGGKKLMYDPKTKKRWVSK